MANSQVTEVAGIGARLAEARELSGLSARELDRIAGRTEGHAAAIERGVRPRIEVETLDAYVRVLGLDRNWLIAGEGRSPTGRSVATALSAARERIAKGA